MGSFVRGRTLGGRRIMVLVAAWEEENELDERLRKDSKGLEEDG